MRCFYRYNYNDKKTNKGMIDIHSRMKVENCVYDIVHKFGPILLNVTSSLKFNLKTSLFFIKNKHIILDKQLSYMRHIFLDMGNDTKREIINPKPIGLPFGPSI
jgi:hypothetical protein